MRPGSLLLLLGLSACPGGDKAPVPEGDTGADTASDSASDSDTATDSGTGDSGTDSDTGTDSDPDTDTDPTADEDGDGYTADVDCDDGDGAINPAAAEVCDEAAVDEDCDGFADDQDPGGATGGSTWYPDADGDGYGANDGTAVTACDLPGGYAADDADCNDADPTTNPAASEICDPANTDEDCSGTADDADPYATGQSWWYLDADGDAFGTPLDTQLTCDQPAGYIADDTDCNDGDGTVNPDGAEVCDAADMDEDCDGLVNDDDPDMSTTGLDVWYEDADRDGYGNPASTTYACDAPSGYVADADDCDDTSSAVTPAATEVCDDGIDNDCDGTPNSCGLSGTIGLSRGSADAKIYGEGAGDSLGEERSLAAAGDLNADGYDDFVIGAYAADAAACSGGPSGDTGASGSTPGTECGEAYVFYGPVTGFASVTTADVILGGPSSDSRFGQSVLGGFDLNGDGRADIAVGAPFHDVTSGSSTWNNAGAVYLFRGTLSAAEEATSADTTVPGTSATDELGAALAAGDFNGDRRDDLVVGDQDTAYVFHGNVTTATLSITSANATLSASTLEDGGLAVGDGDGDGLDDLALGAPYDDTSDRDAGAVFVVNGSFSGTIDLATAADAFGVGEDASDYAGGAVSFDGDANGDGYDDLVIGANAEDAGGSGSGAAYVLFGPVSGYLDLASADVKLYGESADDFCGRSVQWLGDVSGDARDDLLVGCSVEDSAASNAGAAYLLYGTVVTSGSLSIADAKLQGESSEDHAGSTVAGPGDVDGDGTNDLLVGAYGDDDGGSAAGAAYLLLGGGM